MAKIYYYDGKKYVVHEVSEKVAQTYEGISDGEKQECWRKKKRKPENSIDEMIELGIDVVDDTDIQEDYIKREEIERLKKAIDKLPLSYREIIQKYYYEGKSQTDIAKEKGVVKSAINNQLVRILEKLKKILK